MHVRTSVVWILLPVAVLVAAVTGSVTRAQRPDTPTGPDAFGYTVFDHDDPQCDFDWVAIEGSGTTVVWTASGTEPAKDDGGAVVTLAALFELYGEPVAALVMSSNGYLAVASSLDGEDGGDFSNDATLPAIPDNVAGVPARALAYHDDLSGFETGGDAYHQHFAICPRPSEALDSESCTVFQWSNWAAPAGGEAIEFEAVVYHESFEIVVQIRPAPTALSGGTIGIQNAAANVASQYRPPLDLTGDTAVCFLEPRFPAGGPVADLEISKTHKSDTVLPAGSVGYSIGVVNHGPSPAPGVQVVDLVPPSLHDCEWTCTSSTGSLCAPAGSGAITELVDLEPGGWVDYVLVCGIGSTGSDIVNTATVAAPVGWTDPQSGNNAATDVLATAAGRVPDGLDLPGPDILRLDRIGTQLLLSWGASCRATDVDYEVYEGALGSFDSHVPISCGTGGGTTLTHTVPGDDTYYLVVPTNLTFEGSYGQATGDLERSPSAAACLPRSIAGCL
jgi:uncharacterized repeat protein (TIGR01451 family)